jgi:hypothetical protein
MDTDQFPYTDADTEEIDTAKLHAGDLLAGRGPRGSGRWLGRRVDTVRHLPGESFLPGYDWLVSFAGDKPEWPGTKLPARVRRIRRTPA